jgi:hypothetical protein
MTRTMPAAEPARHDWTLECSPADGGHSGEQTAVPVERSDGGRYWRKRKDAIYLFAARLVCQRYCPGPKSVIDIGSNRTPILEWHRRSATRLVSLDLRRPYAAPGVESRTCDLFQYRPDGTFDLVTCFQVLEHVPDPVAFAGKLQELGRVIVVSVPYKWKKGKCKSHVHDPVDEAKMRSWFGREPEFSYVATELNKIARLIHVYTRAPLL